MGWLLPGGFCVIAIVIISSLVLGHALKTHRAHTHAGSGLGEHESLRSAGSRGDKYPHALSLVVAVSLAPQVQLVNEARRMQTRHQTTKAERFGYESKL